MSPPAKRASVSLRTRFVVITLVLGTAGLCALFSWLHQQIAPRYLESMEESLVDTSYLLASVIESDLESKELPVTSLRACFDGAIRRKIHARIYGLQKERIDLRVIITDARGMVVYDSDNRGEGYDYSAWNDIWRTLRGEYGARATRSDPDDPWSLTLYVAAPIRHEGHTVGVISVGKPARASFEFAATAQRKLLWLAAGLTILGTALVLLLAEILVRPLERLRDYALAVRDGHAATLPKLPGRTLNTVGDAIDAMRDSLEGKKTIERYLQTLTHELKSPLAAIRGASELLGENMPAADRPRFYDNIRRETQRMQQIIEKLLQLSTLEARRILGSSERIEATALLREVADGVRPRAEEKSITLEYTPLQEADPASTHGEHLVFSGERFLLKQALGNLLENALDFTPAGGKVTLSVEREAEYVCFVIADTGPGIPAYALERIFERFYSLPRPDTGHKSTGLGLALVREIAHLHKGEVSLRNGPDGNGAIARLRVPCG
ncbi:MAG: two-component system sensor histidine kinase CreC [Verrucomicrobiota bacterium]|nr:two-component system sensor histidine kinase CreC [Verrucomicrobiota bacterium]